MDHSPLSVFPQIPSPAKQSPATSPRPAIREQAPAATWLPTTPCRPTTADPYDIHGTGRPAITTSTSAATPIRPSSMHSTLETPPRQASSIWDPASPLFDTLLHPANAASSINNNTLSANFPPLQQTGASTALTPQPGVPNSTTPTTQSNWRLFIGGLSWESNEDSLRDYFSRFGRVADCVIMRDRQSGHPRGFGFISFHDEAIADRVAAERHEIDGRQVEAKRAVPRSECNPPPPRPPLHHHQNYYFPSTATTTTLTSATATATATIPRPTKKIFVGGLPPTCGDKEFYDYFARFGDIAESQVMYDHQTSNSRGFGFVTFSAETTVERVVSMDHDIMGKFVEVKRAEPKQVLDARRNGVGSALAAAASHHQGAVVPPSETTAMGGILPRTGIVATTNGDVIRKISTASQDAKDYDAARSKKNSNINKIHQHRQRLPFSPYSTESSTLYSLSGSSNAFYAAGDYSSSNSGNPSQVASDDSTISRQTAASSAWDASTLSSFPHTHPLVAPFQNLWSPVSDMPTFAKLSSLSIVDASTPASTCPVPPVLSHQEIAYNQSGRVCNVHSGPSAHLQTECCPSHTASTASRTQNPVQLGAQITNPEFTAKEAIGPTAATTGMGYYVPATNVFPRFAQYVHEAFHGRYTASDGSSVPAFPLPSPVGADRRIYPNSISRQRVDRTYR